MMDQKLPKDPPVSTRLIVYVRPEPTNSRKCRVTCGWFEANPSVRFYGSSDGACRLFTQPIWDMKRTKLCLELQVDDFSHVTDLEEYRLREPKLEEKIKALDAEIHEMIQFNRCMECIGDLETIKKRVLSIIDSMESDHASSSKDRI